MATRKPPVLNYRDVPPAPVPRSSGWARMDIRWIASDRTMGTRTACFWRTVFPPGAAHHKHVHTAADEIFYMIKGRGMHGLGTREYPVQPGDVFYIPRGQVHWMRNTDPHEPIELVGVYIGAPNLEATGYEYRGDIEASPPPDRASPGRRRGTPGASPTPRRPTRRPAAR